MEQDQTTQVYSTPFPVGCRVGIVTTLSQGRGLRVRRTGSLAHSPRTNNRWDGNLHPQGFPITPHAFPTASRSPDKNGIHRIKVEKETKGRSKRKFEDLRFV